MCKSKNSAIMEVFFLLVAIAGPTVTQANVKLDSPNGGEIIQSGAVFTISWHPEPAFAMGDWDLWYCVADEGIWHPVALNLYPGDNTATGSPLTYDWLVPSIGSSAVLMIVRQDASGGQWYDVSDAPFTIMPEPTTLGLLTLGAVGLRLRRRA